jgi:hypothetical protein
MYLSETTVIPHEGTDKLQIKEEKSIDSLNKQMIYGTQNRIHESQELGTWNSVEP